jgi:hypothetical protein
MDLVKNYNSTADMQHMFSLGSMIRDLVKKYLPAPKEE